MDRQRFWPRRQSLLQIALLLTAVAPICVYVAYFQVEPASPSHYIILAVAAFVGVYAAINWAQWALAKHPLIEVGPDGLKVRNALSLKYEEIPFSSVSDIRSEDQVKSNVLRHRFVVYVANSSSAKPLAATSRDLPTSALADQAAAERAITEAFNAYKEKNG